METTTLMTLLGGGVVGFIAALGAIFLSVSPPVVGSVTDKIIKRLEDEGTAIAGRINASLDKYADLSSTIDTIEEKIITIELKIRAIAEKADKIGLRLDEVIALRKDVDRVTRENLNLMNKLKKYREKDQKQTIRQEVGT